VVGDGVGTRLTRNVERPIDVFEQKTPAIMLDPRASIRWSKMFARW
jgi:hypothetical protein